MPKNEKEKLIGRVTHYFDKVGVAVLKLEKDGLKKGETIRIAGGESTDFKQKVSSMEIEHQKIEKAKKGEIIGLKVKEKVREGYKVYKVLG
jgi:putative protease